MGCARRTVQPLGAWSMVARTLNVTDLLIESSSRDRGLSTIQVPGIPIRLFFFSASRATIRSPAQHRIVRKSCVMRRTMAARLNVGRLTESAQGGLESE